MTRIVTRIVARIVTRIVQTEKRLKTKKTEPKTPTILVTRIVGEATRIDNPNNPSSDTSLPHSTLEQVAASYWKVLEKCAWGHCAAHSQGCIVALLSFVIFDSVYFLFKSGCSKKQRL